MLQILDANSDKNAYVIENFPLLYDTLVPKRIWVRDKTNYGQQSCSQYFKENKWSTPKISLYSNLVFLFLNTKRGSLVDVVNIEFQDYDTSFLETFLENPILNNVPLKLTNFQTTTLTNYLASKTKGMTASDIRSQARELNKLQTSSSKQRKEVFLKILVASGSTFAHQSDIDDHKIHDPESFLKFWQSSFPRPGWHVPLFTNAINYIYDNALELPEEELLLVVQNLRDHIFKTAQERTAQNIPNAGPGSET